MAERLCAVDGAKLSFTGEAERAPPGKEGTHEGQKCLEVRPVGVGQEGWGLGDFPGGRPMRWRHGERESPA